LFGALVGTALDFDGIAVFERITYGHIFAVDHGSHTLVTQVCVDAVSKIEYRSSGRQFAQFALRSKYVNFLFVQFQLKGIHQAQRIAFLITEYFADMGHHFVQTFFAAYALVSPMSRQASFGNFVHSGAANLHFDPTATGPQHGGMQRFITIAFRNG